ncbi:hypothetical protein CC78DRAFT_76637 [Lojkania enalia]|uniref:Uncharacterized protein n=1 Tax=Lojkania enalia TaxID=147567 RepID=A0A9P4KEV0_9PLEO|nr:hypothetical protein CC78DRAFT_76637 [Didymosphaeria enalia]
MEEDDIAAAMGFSQFGGAKKRKFDATSSPKANPDASGANSTRLGVRLNAMPEASNNAMASDVQASESDITITPSTEATGQPNPNAKGKLKQPASSSLASFLARGQALEEENVPKAEQSISSSYAEVGTVSFGGLPIPQVELGALRRGVRNENGDTAYFLPSFVEDPWERLEQRPR